VIQSRLQEGVEANMVPDIDKTLERIEDLANTRQDLAVDESLILRGSVTPTLSCPFLPLTYTVLHRPQAGQINVYQDALERLNTSIAFNATDLDLPAAVSLI